MESKEVTKPTQEEFEWIMLKKELGELDKTESFSQRIVRKTTENPFVPIGCGITVFALSYGLYCMKKGNTKMSQNMMRLRVGAQAATIITLVGGVIYTANKLTEENSNK